MHRSGTSLVSQLLHEAGVDFGSTKLLYPADQWNIQGYIETAPILDLNSIFITGIPRTKSRAHAFLSQCIYLTMPDPALVYRRGLKHARDIRQTGKIYDKLAVKDPRFCLTLPLWDTHANVGKVVVCTRHPNRVARSLKHRQALPRSLSLKFWCYHVRSLLENLPPGKTCFFDVDELFTGKGLDTLTGMLKFLDIDVHRVAPDELLAGVFDENLMHNENTPQPALPDAVDKLWKRLTSTAREWNNRTVAAEH